MTMKFNFDFGVSTITVDAPIGGTTAGVPFVYGPIILVPDTAESAGDPVACVFIGKATGAPKVSAQAWSEKDVLYWDTINSAFTNVAGVYKSCGIAAADAANPSSTGEVILGLGSEADSDVNTLIANLASTAGAGTIGILDAALDYTATTVEGALAEVKVIADAASPAADLASDGVGDGSDLIAVVGTADTLTAFLDEVTRFKTKDITVALGASSGTSVGDADIAGGRVVGYAAISGNDQPVESIAVDGGTGVITLTLAGASTAESTHIVNVEIP